MSNNRCYSPVAFGKKTDPTGAYIRKYMPQVIAIKTVHYYCAGVFVRTQPP
jgi:deoxyribodipyrimidine photolyase